MIKVDPTTGRAIGWTYNKPGEMVKFYRAARHYAERERGFRLEWNGKEITCLQQWREEFIRALNQRINAKAPSDWPRRKDSDEYFWQAYRDSRAIRAKLTQRVRVYQFETAEARKRFGYLLSERDD